MSSAPTSPNCFCPPPLPTYPISPSTVTMKLPRAAHLLAILAMRAPFALAAALLAPGTGVSLGAPTPEVSRRISTRDVLSGLWTYLISKLGLASRDSNNEYSSYGEYGYYGAYADYGAYLPDTSPTPATPETPEPCEADTSITTSTTTSTTTLPKAPATTYYPQSSLDDDACTPITSSDHFSDHTTATHAASAAPTTTYLTSVDNPIWTYNPSPTTTLFPSYDDGNTDSTVYITQPITTITVALSARPTTHDMKTYT